LNGIQRAEDGVGAKLSKTERQTIREEPRQNRKDEAGVRHWNLSRVIRRWKSGKSGRTKMVDKRGQKSFLKGKISGLGEAGITRPVSPRGRQTQERAWESGQPNGPKRGTPGLKLQKRMCKAKD